jgi:hypothetical protein
MKRTHEVAASFGFSPAAWLAISKQERAKMYQRQYRPRRHKPYTREEALERRRATYEKVNLARRGTYDKNDPKMKAKVVRQKETYRQKQLLNAAANDAALDAAIENAEKKKQLKILMKADPGLRKQILKERARERKRAFLKTAKGRAQHQARKKKRIKAILADPVKGTIYRAARAANKRARTALLKQCPHCGGEVTVDSWKRKIEHDRLQNSR